MYCTAGVLIIMTAGACLGQTMNDTQNILNFILTGYNLDIRPAVNQSLPVEVNISTEIVNVKEFDEVSESLTVVIVLYMWWWDSRLMWDPLEHNNTDIITIPANKIWKPNLILSTPVAETRPIGGKQDWAMVNCEYDGTVFWNAADIISSSCNVDVRYFPFDVQKCELNFIPWGHATNEIVLSANEDKVFKDLYMENGAWNLTDSVVLSRDIDGHLSMYSATLVLERRPLFFLVNAVLPVIFISFLNVLVFLIPVESGERVSFAITVYLSLAVFMTVVTNNMPKTSKKMAIICYFLLINIAHSSLICLEIIVCMVTYYHQGPVPLWLSYIFIRKSNRAKERKLKNEIIEAVYDDENQFKIKKQIENPDEKLAENSCHQAVVNTTWRDISRTLDKIFGVLSIFLLFFFVVLFIVVVPSNMPDT